MKHKRRRKFPEYFSVKIEEEIQTIFLKKKVLLFSFLFVLVP
jgi:hypothetical protein